MELVRKFVTIGDPAPVAAQPAVSAAPEMVFRCTDSTPDRIGDRVFVAGMDLSKFLTNPVLQWAHDGRTPAVGTAKRLWVEGDALFMEPEFSNATPKAREIEALVREYTIRTVSIGFIPLEAKPNDLGGYDFLKSELTEISFCNVPMNPSAVRVKALHTEDAMDPMTLKIAKALAALVKADEEPKPEPEESAAEAAKSAEEPKPEEPKAATCPHCGAETAAKAAEEPPAKEPEPEPTPEPDPVKAWLSAHGMAA